MDNVTVLNDWEGAMIEVWVLLFPGVELPVEKTAAGWVRAIRIASEEKLRGESIRQANLYKKLERQREVIRNERARADGANDMATELGSKLATERERSNELARMLAVDRTAQAREILEQAMRLMAMSDTQRTFIVEIPETWMTTRMAVKYEQLIRDAVLGKPHSPQAPK